MRHRYFGEVQLSLNNGKVQVVTVIFKRRKSDQRTAAQKALERAIEDYKHLDFDPEKAKVLFVSGVHEIKGEEPEVPNEPEPTTGPEEPAVA